MKWIKAGTRGVRYWEHETRRHGLMLDRYFSIRYRVDGKYREEGLGWWSQGMTEKRAAANLAELHENVRLGNGPRTIAEKRAIEERRRAVEYQEQQQAKAETITFGEFFEKHYFPISQLNKSPESYRKEREHFDNWIKHTIGHVPLKQLVALDIERLKQKMVKAGKSPRMIEYVFATIRQTWNMAKRDKLVSHESPTKEVKRPKIKNKRMRFLTEDEIARLLERLSVQSRQLHGIAVISLDCGLRAGEIFDLTWGRIDFTRGTILVIDSKGEDRTAYMTERVKAMLAGMPQGKSSELIFKSRDGGRIKQVSNAFDRAVNALGYNDGITDRKQKIVFHSLRHTYASRLVEAGVDMYVVKTLMGHSTLAITERYSHLGENALTAAVKVLDSKARQPTADIIQMNERATS